MPKESKFKEKEWEYPKNNTFWPTQQRRRKLKDLSEEIGLYNVNLTQLAMQMGISRTMIYNDIKALYKQGLDKDVLAQAKVNIDSAHKKVMKEMQKLVFDSKEKVSVSNRIRAANTLLSANEKHTDFLEKFGEKAKVAERVESKTVVMWDDGEEEEDGEEKEGDDQQ